MPTTPTAPLRVALAQIDTTVGDIEANAAKIRDWFARAREAGAHLVAFPELSLSGYPPEDLLLREDFLAATRSALEDLAADVRGATALVGFPELDGAVYNSLAVLREGEIAQIYRKVLLPNYGVFDEKRYFTAGGGGVVCEVPGGDAGGAEGATAAGLTICEDIWETGPPASEEAAAGARLIVNISASPYHQLKGRQRESMLVERALAYGTWIVLCNAVGGQDELVFDGHSVVVDPAGRIVARGRQFEEELVVFDVDGDEAAAPIPELLGEEEEVYAALVLGTRDYVEKNGFEAVLVGVSGGIDSALTATIAVDALGAGRVKAAVMPSSYSSPETQDDARALGRNLGIESFELPIPPAVAAYDVILGEAFSGTEPGVAEENIQARIRGTLLMALSNKFGWLVLTTGNKSEYSVGYTTLYGDMAGGFAVLKDVPKTLVYELAQHRNSRSPEAPIPERVLIRPPSAELRPGQLDTDTLPPYDDLDPVLEAYVERDQGREQLVAAGFEPQLVDRVIAMVDGAEYKRRQAPPGIKIRPKAFGRDRRLPITNRYG